MSVWLCKGRSKSWPSCVYENKQITLSIFVMGFSSKVDHYKSANDTEDSIIWTCHNFFTKTTRFKSTLSASSSTSTSSPLLPLRPSSSHRWRRLPYWTHKVLTTPGVSAANIWTTGSPLIVTARTRRDSSR